MSMKKEVLYSNLPTISIEEFFGYINEIEGGYINANYHQEDNNLVILNYTELATFEKRWNKYTMSARGMILDLTYVKNNGKIYVLAKPFEKFPNYGTNEIQGYEDDIDFEEIESITEKMDGSLGISYFFKDEIRFATRGSFNSDQALMATEIWREKYADRFDWLGYLTFPYTMLTEIIYPENRVVVNYNGMRDLVMLGVINISFMKDEPIETVRKVAEKVGMQVTPEYKTTLHKLLEMKETISANEEGWVIKFKNGKRLKIKGSEYLQVHRVYYGLSDKAKVKAWSEGKMDEYIKALPEEFRPELEELVDDLNKVKDSIYFMLQLMFEMAKLKTDDRKSFAIYVNELVDKKFRRFMFEAYDKGSINTDSIRSFIFKNYEEYLGVINTWGTFNNQNS